MGAHAGEGSHGLPAGADGVGPLLERDYRAVLRCELSPREVADVVARRFEELAPAELASFRRETPGVEPLDVGDELEVRIRGYGTAFVRVVHKGEDTLTIATLPHHPEAGRISFHAYRDERGLVVFHIRSRARSSSRVARLGFLLGGEDMQAQCWTDFIERLGAMVGDGCQGPVATATRTVDEKANDRPPLDEPTFRSRLRSGA